MASRHTGVLSYAVRAVQGHTSLQWGWRCARHVLYTLPLLSPVTMKWTAFVSLGTLAVVGQRARHVWQGRTRPPRDLNHALLARWVRHLSQAVPDQGTVRVTLGTPLLSTEDVLLVPVALTKTTSDLDPALIVEPILNLTQRVRRLPILALHARPILCLYQEV